MFGQDRKRLRRFYLDCWNKHSEGVPLEPLERLVAEIVALHPEYHRWLSEEVLDRDWTPEDGETNPFLHMGMHISLGEQLQSDRPAGVRTLYSQIAARQGGDLHAAEHLMMDCLGLALWEAQREQRAPDEAAFLECLRQLAKR
jgi:hypothetical protein